MSDIKTSCVICPGCTHQFEAIPLDTQEEIKSLRSEAQLGKDQESSMQHEIDVLASERDEWKRRAKLLWKWIGGLGGEGQWHFKDQIPEAAQWFEEE